MSILLVLFFSSCHNSKSNFETILPSPDSKKHLYFNLNDGEPYYLLYYEDQILVDWSMLGFIIDDTIKFGEGLQVEDAIYRTSTHTEEDLFPDSVEDLDTFNEMTIFLDKANCPNIKLFITLRLYNNAIAFKYIFNQLGAEKKVTEITELDLYENYFKEVNIRDTIPNELYSSELSIGEVDTLNLPAVFISEKDFKIDYLESIVQDYPSMKLVRRNPDKAEFQMKYADDNIQKVSIEEGFETPWRIIYISK